MIKVTALGTIVEWVEALCGWSAYAGRPEAASALGLTASIVPPAPAFSPSVLTTFASFIAYL